LAKHKLKQTDQRQLSALPFERDEAKLTVR